MSALAISLQTVSALDMAVVHFHVKSPFTAVTATPDHKFVTIPAGVIIDSSDDVKEPGLRRIVCDGRDLLAFARDIRERAEILTTKIPK